MGKNKLKKFADMAILPNVFQCSMSDLETENAAVKMAGHWRENYFRNVNPLVLELGCGHGDYTVGLSRQYPNKNFIGIDIKGARMWHGARQAFDAGMSNVAFLRTNIEMLPRFFRPDEVDEIWITFPDPQMKKVTKRLTSTWFMQRYQQLLRPAGLIHLKTDSPFLYTYTRAMLQQNAYPILSDTDDLYSDLLPQEDITLQQTENLRNARALQTHYEKQWLDRGLTIKYLCWSLVPKTTWEEPDIEIEKDNYRSYGRNYRTSNN
ncbi:MAG: tRNA (guanosine(46)-N7)-methyltransferase TrmB [Paludibacteraceae bacterium]|nr:tRNA (guanosine(46)-N7)-methyltransferase TrmB [Paludibacteraceae bacterium]